MAIKEFEQSTPDQQRRWLAVHKILTNIYICSMKKTSYPWYKRWDKKKCRIAYADLEKHEALMKWDCILPIPKELQSNYIIKWIIIVSSQLYLFLVPMTHKVFN